jgi:hypothetical protein
MCLSTFTSVTKIDYINIRSERHIKDLCSRRLILTLLRYIHHPKSLSNQLLFTKTLSPTTFTTSTPTNQPNQQPHQQCLPPPVPSPSPAAAATAAVSAPKRPSAPAASSPPCNAPARSRPPRTRPLALGVRAVSPIKPPNNTRTIQHANDYVSSDQRPAGECTCSRASNENDKPSGNACACGKRSANACNCEGTEVGAGKASELETDFTTKA